MADIRPSSGPTFPTTSPARPAEPAGRTAAQRAFFEAALGKAQATDAPLPAVQAQPAASPVRAERVIEVNEQPTRFMRPGSLLDIKV